MKRTLLIDIPVIHRGFIDFLTQNKNDFNKIGILSPQIIENHSKFKRDIASLEFGESKKILEELGFSDIGEVFEKDLELYSQKFLSLIDDEVSRSIFKKYLADSDVVWSKVFLRWDRSKVLSDNSKKYPVSNDGFDKEIMKRTYEVSDQSSDWWRQVGAILVRDKKILLESYNQAIPSDHTPYQVGAIRDFMAPGEKPELANYIHGEQKIICEAAKDGIKLKGASLYVTHFPCSVCSKLIAASGIKNLFFAEGSSNSDGEIVLKSAGVIIKQVKGEK